MSSSEYQKLTGTTDEHIVENVDKDDYGTFERNKGIRKTTVKYKLKGNRLLVVVCVLLTELCERLTYYSIAANLILFCTSKLHTDSGDAATISLVFTGTSYLLPVIGGYVADSVAGKYNAILGAGFIYVVGLFLLPASAVDYVEWFGFNDDGSRYDLNNGTRMAFFFVGLALIAIGTGGIKANVGPFGAQQVKDLGPEAVQSFFNWYYWFINVGSLFAYAGVAYVQQEVSFAVGFAIPFGSMILALILFVAVKNRYIHVPPSGSILSESVNICCQAKCRSFASTREINGGMHTDKMVDGVVAVFRVIPIFLLVIFFWAIYSQMQSTFFLQSERMDITIGDFQLPAAFLNVFNTVMILLFVPILDKIIYPLLSKIDKHPTTLQRIGFGLLLSSISVFLAGVIEIYRKKQITGSKEHQQVLAGETFNASSMSVFLQVPQFALVGASEVFASITGMEFAFSQAPEHMQGLVMGLFLMTAGIGTFVSIAILQIVEVSTESDPWFPDDINDGKTEYLFFLLGGLAFLNFIVFIPVAKCYRYKHFADETREQDLPESQITSSTNPYERSVSDNGDTSISKL